MNLYEFAQRYVDRRDISTGYAANLLARARALENHAGRPELAACLAEDVVNRFLAQLATSRAAPTVRGYRSDLLTLWLAAADENRVPYPVTRRIRPVKVPASVVQCYSLADARLLLSAAQTLTGGYPHGVGRSAYWDAAIRLAWDSGLRRGDVWTFDLEDVDRLGQWRKVQRKTGRLATGRLHRSTVDALQRIGRRLPCEWSCHPNAFTVAFRKLVKRSGVGRGTFRWLRRSSGSHVEALAPGMGAKHLGHASPQTFARHYDAQLAVADRPQPPEL